MARRDKSRFEKWFSLSRHKRRAGAQEMANQISLDFAAQKKIIIEGDELAYTHGSTNDIEKHFVDLKREFTNQPELCYTHAKLIVLIRREFEPEKHFQLFEQLWGQEKKFLLANLNTRWLLSATDTFADHSKNDAVRALSLACACLINTIKIQETERFITNAQKCVDDESKIECLKNERVALFDGTSAFAVGTDDTLRNMRWKIDKASKINVGGEILFEIFARIQEHDTVYRRLKARHSRKKTGWWV
jgi:hypothetical protein